MSKELSDKIKDKVNRFRYFKSIIRDDLRRFQKNHPSYFNLSARDLGSETSLSDEEYKEFLELEDFLFSIYKEIGSQIN